VSSSLLNFNSFPGIAEFMTALLIVLMFGSYKSCHFINLIKIIFIFGIIGPMAARHAKCSAYISINNVKYNNLSSTIGGHKKLVKIT
jgi:hypothetical protein